MTRRPAAVVTMVAAVLLLPSGSAGAPDAAVDVQDNVFVPAEVTIAPGDTVTWTQTGSNPHSVTADDGSFDSHPDCPDTCMAQGDTFQHTFEEAGTFAYYCKIHGGPGGAGMSGVVEVEGPTPTGVAVDLEPAELPDDLAETGGSPLPFLLGGAALAAAALGLAWASRRGRSGA
ncbi:MAG: plastocyanin/azurin family copper-binding protein [Actinomycetota bacterium]